MNDIKYIIKTTGEESSQAWGSMAGVELDAIDATTCEATLYAGNAANFERMLNSDDSVVSFEQIEWEELPANSEEYRGICS